MFDGSIFRNFTDMASNVVENIGDTLQSNDSSDKGGLFGFGLLDVNVNIDGEPLSDIISQHAESAMDFLGGLAEGASEAINGLIDNVQDKVDLLEEALEGFNAEVTLDITTEGGLAFDLTVDVEASGVLLEEAQEHIDEFIANVDEAIDKVQERLPEIDLTVIFNGQQVFPPETAIA